MTEPNQDVEALALRCARGEVPVYQLVEAIAAATGREKVEVLFGPCADRPTARQHMKAALHAARSEEQARRVRSGQG